MSDCPDQGAPAGCWNAWVAAGATREDRAKRLSQAPEALRQGIESHVRTVFAIAAYHRRRLQERGRLDTTVAMWVHRRATGVNHVR